MRLRQQTKLFSVRDPGKGASFHYPHPERMAITQPGLLGTSYPGNTRPNPRFTLKGLHQHLPGLVVPSRRAPLTIGLGPAPGGNHE